MMAAVSSAKTAASDPPRRRAGFGSYNNAVSADEIRSRLSMVELLQRDVVSLRRQGPNLVGLCPFHQEKSPSFTVFADNKGGHAHCFGCGFHGSIFDYWMQRTGADFKTTKDALAVMVGLSASAQGSGAIRPAGQAKVTPLSLQPSRHREKPALPTMRALNENEMVALAHVRGLTIEAIRFACEQKRIGFCRWPQFLGQGVLRPEGWYEAEQCFPSWVITDASRNVAQFRRLDGEKYVLHDREIKAWTKGSPTWPVGAAALLRSEVRGEKSDVRNVLLVEGGPDLLAAYFFLLADWRLKSGRRLRVPSILPMAMLGASCAIAESALALFGGKRVRIIIHNDAPNKTSGRVPSYEAAARWTEQLTAAGAAVETFSLAGIRRQISEVGGREEKEISDLNDLALCPPEVWQSDEIRAAFLDWDF